MELYPHQLKMVTDARESLRAHRSCILRSPTGSGKTVVASRIILSCYERSRPAIFTVHRRELIDQTAVLFREFGIPFGVISPEYEQTDSLIQIASIETLRRRDLPIPDLLVCDECQHSIAATWQETLNKYGSKLLLGLSATPSRTDGRGLGGVFKSMVHGPETKWLQDNGFLAPYRYYAPAIPATDQLPVRAGDYTAESVAEMMDKPSVTGDAVAHYKRLCPDSRAIAFCATVSHAENTAAIFRTQGIPAEAISGKTPKAERDAAIESFRNGEIRVLCNCDLISEGFDCPAMETAILLRPTQSLALFLQQVGRCLRYQPGKVAFSLDHSGNGLRHGLPNQVREWSLEDTARKPRGEQVEAVRICSRCLAAYEITAACCPYCGAVKEPTPREIKQREGELQEIRELEIKRTQRIEVGRAQTLQDLEAIARARGYKSQWVRIRAKLKGII